MVFKSLQHRIAIVFVGLLVLVMALILGLVNSSSQRIVTGEVKRELAMGAKVFQRLVEENQRQIEMAATVLSSDFAFREAIATQDQPTMRSVIRNHGLRIGAQVMMVISPDGMLIASTQHMASAGDAFPFVDLLAAAQSAGRSAGFKEMRNGQLYQVVLVPILAPTRIAWVAMGFQVDDRWARDLAEITGLAVSIVRSTAARPILLASSLDGARQGILAQSLAGLPSHEGTELSIDGESFQTVRIPLEADIWVVLQRSVEQVRAPFRSLQATLLTVVLGGVLVFTVGSIMLSRRIVRPLDQLSTSARRIEAGDYSQPLSGSPHDEIGRLATSLDRMREGIATREERIVKLAYVDPLTDLPNRTRFVEAFTQLMPESGAAIVILNLDRFALINNALGLPVGDRLLCEIAWRLRDLLPASGTFARLWGDQFAFLLDGADKPQALSFAQCVLAMLRDPVTLDGQRLDLSGSLGIALYPQDGTDVNTLLRRAELAMSAAKRRHDGMALVSDIGAEPAHEQLSLIGEMREAMERDEFVVYYQPKLALATGKIVGAEALLRWEHPTRGMISPMRFIPFAEQTGFIREITPWVLDRVGRQIGHWKRAGLSITVSANLSASDLLSATLGAHVRDTLQRYGISAESLCLEITESALMDDPALALSHLTELAALGIRLSIDDYGVGQASLAYLKTLPVNELKIDRTFVSAVADAPKHAAIVQSTIMLSHALGLTVVAEGVESSRDLAWLADNGCDIAQGFGIARPMRAQDLAEWIAQFSAEEARQV